MPGQAPAGMLAVSRSPSAELTFILLGMSPHSPYPSCMGSRRTSALLPVEYFCAARKCPPAPRGMLPVSLFELRSRKKKDEESTEPGDIHSAGNVPRAHMVFRTPRLLALQAAKRPDGRKRSLTCPTEAGCLVITDICA